MKNAALILFAFLLGTFSATVFPPASAAPPPPESTEISINLQADRDFLRDHEEVAEKLHGQARRVVNAAEALALAESSVADLGARVYRGITRYKPGLVGTLPVTITDIAYRRVDDAAPFGEITKADTIDALLLNEAAAGQ